MAIVPRARCAVLCAVIFRRGVFVLSKVFSFFCFTFFSPTWMVKMFIKYCWFLPELFFILVRFLWCFFFFRRSSCIIHLGALLETYSVCVVRCMYRLCLVFRCRGGQGREGTRWSRVLVYPEIISARFHVVRYTQSGECFNVPYLNAKIRIPCVGTLAFSFFLFFCSCATPYSLKYSFVYRVFVVRSFQARKKRRGKIIPRWSSLSFCV